MRRFVHIIRDWLSRGVWRSTLPRLLGCALGLFALSFVGLRAAASWSGAAPQPSSAVAAGVLTPFRSENRTGPTPSAVLVRDAPSPAGSSDLGNRACDGPGSARTADGRLILNRAQESDLVKLPGVGPKRARAILQLRQRLGQFRSVRDLLRVRGIGHRSLRKLKPLVVVDALESRT